MLHIGHYLPIHVLMYVDWSHFKQRRQNDNHVISTRWKNYHPKPVEVKPTTCIFKMLLNNDQAKLYIYVKEGFHFRNDVCTILKEILLLLENVKMKSHHFYFLGSKIWLNLTLSPPRVSLWRVKSSGVRQSKIYKWPLVVKGLTYNSSTVEF